MRNAPLLNFQLWYPSGNISYDASYRAVIEYPKINGNSRAIIIGMQSGPNALALRNTLRRLEVGERKYKHGDDFPLSVLAGSPRAAVDSVGSPTRILTGTPYYFPGSPDAFMLGESGERIAGIPINGAEQVTLEIEDLSDGSAAITQLALLLAVVPRRTPMDDPEEMARLNAIFDGLMRGVGALNAYGMQQALTTAGLSGTRLQQKLAGSYPQRRIDVRGHTLNSASSYAYDETVLAQINGQLSTEDENGQSNRSVPIQFLLGNAGMRGPANMVDMKPESYMYLDLTTTSAPAGNRQALFACLTEGLPMPGPKGFVPLYRAGGLV